MKSTLRSRWKFLATLAAMLTVGVTASWLLIRKPQEREEFVGKVDPVSGYRCRLTVSTAWSHKDGLNGGLQRSQRLLDYDNFAPPPPSTLRAWIESHLLGRPTARFSGILLRTFASAHFAGYVQIRDGYPDPVPSSQEHIVTQRHLKIDGYPATIVVSDGVGFGLHGHDTALFVYVPDSAILYHVAGGSTVSSSHDADREMQAIIASFHVEKAGVPAGGKLGGNRGTTDHERETNRSPDEYETNHSADSRVTARDQHRLCRRRPRHHQA